MSDIIDAIDALVSEQLATGPVDDYNVNRYDKCPHCQRDWHGMPVTVRIAQMYATGQFEDDYRVADDDTLVLCEGSEFIGPQRPPPTRELWSPWGPTVSPWLQQMVATSYAYVAEALGFTADLVVVDETRDGQCR